MLKNGDQQLLVCHCTSNSSSSKLFPEFVTLAADLQDMFSCSIRSADLEVVSSTPSITKKLFMLFCVSVSNPHSKNRNSHELTAIGE